MGPEDEKTYTVYWNGVPITPTKTPVITLAEDAPEAEITLLCEPMEFTMYIKTPKRWRCGSRKRFIKLLMSKGISRNQAGSVAKVARIARVPYGELWRDYFFWG